MNKLKSTILFYLPIAAISWGLIAVLWTALYLSPNWFTDIGMILVWAYTSLEYIAWMVSRKIGEID